MTGGSSGSVAPSHCDLDPGVLGAALSACWYGAGAAGGAGEAVCHTVMLGGVQVQVHFRVVAMVLQASGRHVMCGKDAWVEVRQTPCAGPARPLRSDQLGTPNQTHMHRLPEDPVYLFVTLPLNARLCRLLPAAIPEWYQHLQVFNASVQKMHTS
jgi:hypothetical protein